MKEAKARDYSEKVQLASLLHDASEAYLSDVTRPVKKELPKYLEIEKPLQDAIWNKYLDVPVLRSVPEIGFTGFEQCEREFLHWFRHFTALK